MNKLSLFIVSLALTLLTNLATAQTYNLDVQKSKLNWLGKKVTGEHHGTIKFKSGKVEFKGSDLKGAEFEVDMDSIVNEDLTSAEYNKKLVGHLKSEDFFSVEKFKTAKLKVKDVILGKGGVYNVTADLTIKGITAPVTFDVTAAKKDKEATAQGKLIFDRTKFEVKYGSGKFFSELGDKLIYDDIELNFVLKATL